MNFRLDLQKERKMKKIIAIFLMFVVCGIVIIRYNSGATDELCKTSQVLSGALPAMSGQYTACYHTMVTDFSFDQDVPGGHYLIEVHGTPYSYEFYGSGYPAGHNHIVDTTYCSTLANHQLHMDVFTGDKSITNCVFKAEYLPPSQQQ
jgi:hypothetical protein